MRRAARCLAASGSRPEVDGLHASTGFEEDGETRERRERFDGRFPFKKGDCKN